jgi:hypothetical protein
VVGDDADEVEEVESFLELLFDFVEVAELVLLSLRFIVGDLVVELSVAIDFLICTSGRRSSVAKSSLSNPTFLSQSLGVFLE